MNFEAIIGLEIHVQMRTESKMFSSAPVTFGKTPNSFTSPLDLAFPGALPIVNKQAVINAIRVCNALHMEIDDLLVFERKNYFYSDLPKGYQITQQFRPIGKNGYLTINLNGVDKKICIKRLHLEEDTCKQHHTNDVTLLDYNRSGIPLLEIVSEPTIKSGLEAVKYVDEIRSIVSFLGVSNGKMEEGSLRVDVNVSLINIESGIAGTKVEIKNLNSFSNIQKAIDYEIKRQSNLFDSGQKVKQETLKYDESKKKTIPMRIKTSDVDYKFFTDPNIVSVKLSKEFIDETIKTSPELAKAKYFRYRELGLSDYDCALLTSEKDVYYYFELSMSKCSPKLLANWINGEIQSYLNKTNASIKDFPIKSDDLCELIQFIESGEISNNQAKLIFNEMLNTGKEAKTIIKDMGLSQESVINVLVSVVKQVLDNNTQAINDYKAGKNRAVGYLVSQVMKFTNGKANPSITNKLIIEELQRR